MKLIGANRKDVHKTFSFPIFGYRLKVSLTGSVGTFARKLYPDLPDSQTADNVEGIHVHDDASRSHIILPYGVGICTIVHEVSHFVWKLMAFIGADHENEIMAYHMGYTVERICLWIQEVDPIEEATTNCQIPLDKGPET